MSTRDRQNVELNLFSSFYSFAVLFSQIGDDVYKMLEALTFCIKCYSCRQGKKSITTEY